MEKLFYFLVLIRLRKYFSHFAQTIKLSLNERPLVNNQLEVICYHLKPTVPYPQGYFATPQQLVGLGKVLFG